MAVEYDGAAKGHDTLQGMHTVQFFAPDMSAYDVSPFLSALHRTCKQREWFNNPGCTETLNDGSFGCSLYTIDTLVTYKPETYEEQIKVLDNEIGGNSVLGYAVRHRIRCDAQMKNVTAEIIAFSQTTRHGYTQVDFTSGAVVEQRNHYVYTTWTKI